MSDSLRTWHLGIDAKLEEELLTKDAEGRCRFRLVPRPMGIPKRYMNIQTINDFPGINLLIGLEARAPNFFVNLGELGLYGELFMGTWKKEPPLKESS